MIHENKDIAAAIALAFIIIQYFIFKKIDMKKNRPIIISWTKTSIWIICELFKNVSEYEISFPREEFELFVKRMNDDQNLHEGEHHIIDWNTYYSDQQVEEDLMMYIRTEHEKVVKKIDRRMFWMLLLAFIVGFSIAFSLWIIFF
jgi:hypothetical protein